METISETYITKKEISPLILIVDDDVTNITILEAVLEKAEIKFISATGGQEAIDTVKDVLPDLILLDIMMPRISGYEVCRIIKSSPRTENLPVIFLTAMTEKTDIVKGFEAGAVDYLTKPFNNLELIARIRTHLELKKLRENQEKVISELNDALKNIKKLSGLLPFCSCCKKIRDDKGYWNRVDNYIQTHSKIRLTHGICPECTKKLYSDLYKDDKPGKMN